MLAIFFTVPRPFHSLTSADDAQQPMLSDSLIATSQKVCKTSRRCWVLVLAAISFWCFVVSFVWAASSVSWAFVAARGAKQRTRW